ncbi:MAG: type III-A CRISPR-associated RAMP protein Csm5 [Phycisphaerae bacterium]
MITYKIKATVVTPISIGDGSQYSPYKDYFIYKGRVYYVDEQKIGELLAKDHQLMTEYVEGVANMEGNRSRFDLKDFIQNRLQMDAEFLNRKELDFYGNALSKLPINGFVKNPNGYPYIPGSSIKGAIKTALIYTDLEKASAGEKWKEDFFRTLSRIDFNRSVNERFLQGRLKKQLDELEFMLKRKAEEKSKSGFIERLAISDSSIIDKNQLQIIDLKRTQIPVRQEALKVNTNFYFTFSSPNEEWESFGEKLNRFAFNNLSDYEDNRKEVFSQVDNAFNNNHGEVFLPLGFGKGIYLNSILMSLKDYAYDNESIRLFENYLKVLSPRTKNMNIYSFPNTFFKTYQDNLPLGWIKLEKID